MLSRGVRHMQCYLALVDLVCEFGPLQRHLKVQCDPGFLPHLGGGARRAEEDGWKWAIDMRTDEKHTSGARGRSTKAKLAGLQAARKWASESHHPNPYSHYPNPYPHCPYSCSHCPNPYPHYPNPDSHTSPGRSRAIGSVRSDGGNSVQRQPTPTRWGSASAVVLGYHKGCTTDVPVRKCARKV